MRKEKKIACMANTYTADGGKRVKTGKFLFAKGFENKKPLQKALI